MVPSSRIVDKLYSVSERRESLMGMPAHLVPVVDHIRSLPVAAPPAPWKSVGAFAVGGLTDVGFAPGSDNLLVISSRGRGLFDCVSGKKIARNPDDDFDFNTSNLEVEGIDNLEGTMIRTSGLHGGGLAKLTSDGWCAEELFIDWPEATLLLVEPDSWAFEKAFDKPANYTKVGIESEIRAWGFSPTGKSLVLATFSDLMIFSR